MTPNDHSTHGPDLTKRVDHSSHDPQAMPDMHPDARPDAHKGHGGHGGHGWMMIACCIPMLAIAGVLVATGVLSVGFLFFAVACTAMMAMMMRGMNHGGGRS